jgi:hypothetical protein
MTYLSAVIGFLVALVVSTIIIYVVTTLFGEKKSIGTAVIAALVGAAIYAVVYFFFGGIIAAVIAGLAWLIALGSLYKIGWLRAIVTAIVIWIITEIVGFFLPTL